MDNFWHEIELSTRNYKEFVLFRPKILKISELIFSLFTLLVMTTACLSLSWSVFCFIEEVFVDLWLCYMYSLAGENLLRRKYQIFLYHFMNKILGLSRPARRVSIRSSVSLCPSVPPSDGNSFYVTRDGRDNWRWDWWHQHHHTLLQLAFLRQ